MTPDTRGTLRTSGPGTTRRRALQRADLCEGIVAPLPWLTQQWAPTSSGPAGARSTSLHTHSAARNHVPCLHKHPSVGSGRVMRDAGS